MGRVRDKGTVDTGWLTNSQTNSGQVQWEGRVCPGETPPRRRSELRDTWSTDTGSSRTPGPTEDYTKFQTQ